MSENTEKVGGKKYFILLLSFLLSHPQTNGGGCLLGFESDGKVTILIYKYIYIFFLGGGGGGGGLKYSQTTCKRTPLGPEKVAA